MRDLVFSASALDEQLHGQLSSTLGLPLFIGTDVLGSSEGLGAVEIGSVLHDLDAGRLRGHPVAACRAVMSAVPEEQVTHQEHFRLGDAAKRRLSRDPMLKPVEYLAADDEQSKRLEGRVGGWRKAVRVELVLGSLVGAHRAYFAGSRC